MLFAADGTTLTPPVASQQSEIIVTGSRVATAPDDLAANVTVLTREDFDVEKPTQLADVLSRVAGVHVDEVGGRGGTGSLYLRGADPNYTLVLVDGVRVNDPTNARGGSFDFSTLDIADVERVEVARGPYSAVYGGDALAGVINIVTRHAPRDSTGVTFDAMGGAYDTRELSLNAGGPVGGGNWNFGVSDSNQGPVVRGNHFDGQRASASLDTTLGADTTLFVSGRYSKSDRDTWPDDSGGYEFSAIRDTEHRKGNESVFGAGVNTNVGNATFGLTLGYFDHDDNIDSPGVAPGVRDPFGIPPSLVDTNLTRYTATLTGTQKFADFLTLAYGVDWMREKGTSDGSLDFGGGFVLPTSFELTRTTWAPFAEARIDSHTGLSAQLGVRVDKPDGGESSVTSPRVRVAYDIANSGFTIAGAWGKAYKLPSMYALGHPIVGNPDLLPERGQSHEIELSQAFAGGRAHWSATYFDGEFRNAIDFDSATSKLVNRNRVDTHGVEFAGRFAASDALSFDASVTNAQNRIASTGGELRNRPEWRAGAAAHWSPFAALKLSAAATYVGGSLDSSIATGDVRMDSYTTLDVSAAWEFSPRLEAWLAVDNLTDEQYAEFVGNEVRGIMPRAGVRFSF